MTSRKRNVRLLLIEDDEDDYLLFKTLLCKIPDNNFELYWEKDYRAALAEVRKQDHDIYVVDYRLAAESGLSVLEELGVAEWKQPFIVLTGAANRAIEERSMELGAADYLVKGSFDSSLLARVLSYSIQRKVQEEQRIQHLVEINRSKDEFIALASHELRTPATIVKQYVSMVIEGLAGEVNPRQADFLARAYASNERQLHIIEDILRVARLDLDQITLHRRKTDICALVRTVIDEIAVLTAKRGQTVKTTLPKEPLIINIDPQFVRMALTNIINNASKYTHDNKRIEIVIERDADEVVVTVSDQGVGIAKADFSRLFVKFSRIHNELTIERGGTGLGLYWAREIIEMHEGTITATSKKGVGTTFAVRLRA